VFLEAICFVLEYNITFFVGKHILGKMLVFKLHLCLANYRPCLGVNGVIVLQGLRGEDSAVDLHRPFLRWLMKKVRRLWDG
jgi:hypothetical protein